MENKNIKDLPTPKNPTAQKIMNWMEFLLRLCKLMKSILAKVFLWVEDWENHIQNKNTSSAEA